MAGSDLSQGFVVDQRRQFYRPRPALHAGWRRDGGAWGAARGRALSRHADRPRAACGGFEGGAGRHQGAADEGRATARDDPRGAARGVCPRAADLAGQRAGDGLALRASPHGGRTGAGLAEPLQELRARGGAGRVVGPGAPGRRARWHNARLQAAISGHGIGGRSRSAPAQARDGALRALRQNRQHRPKSTPRSPTGCARNSITNARPRICGSTAKSSRTNRASRCRARSPNCQPGVC